ncbi:MAG: glucosaminidase domain-containing protein [Proteobacteria bacterium]|nr:glucosaminidase domain-containing protein [Pseudomonadota bacterium]MBU4297068.1 glucosaminidase domain-containing protein [Pseudomonadota bacterium]MCG2749949.1 glucosaminidase domain-containing protein [Desulfobulbaceae bacterium]
MKKTLITAAVLGAVILVSLACYLYLHQPITHRPWEVPEEEPEKLTLESAGQIWDYYESIGYTRCGIENANFEVPRIYMDTIYSSLEDDQPVASKKSLFYRTMLPLVLRVNEQISAERKYLQVLEEQYREGNQPDDEDLAWLENLAWRYKVVKEDGPVDLTDEFFKKIFLRVDTIPVSIALGQMAYESGYATSRFATEGNALFGQWCWGGEGMMPENQREDRGDYRIADFPTLLDSIKAYAMNINTHTAYRNFRLARAEQRLEQKEDLDVYSLLSTLEFYSEKRQEYVETLQGIIGHNKLTIFDRAKLSQGRPVVLMKD